MLSYDKMLFDRQLYSFTNEHLGEVFDALCDDDYQIQNVLTVGSGDQAFHAIMFGATYVVNFDINPNTKHLYELKKSAILNLDFDEYQKGLSSVFLAPEFYDKLKDTLPRDTQEFWENVDKKRIFRRQDDGNPYNSVYNSHKQGFEFLKNILKNQEYKVEFLTSDFYDIHEHLSPDIKFDLMLFSNIAQYECQLDGTKGYVKQIQNLTNFLSPKGKMQLNYEVISLNRYSTNLKIYEAQPQTKALAESLGADNLERVKIVEGDSPLDKSINAFYRKPDHYLVYYAPNLASKNEPQNEEKSN